MAFLTIFHSLYVKTTDSFLNDIYNIFIYIYNYTSAMFFLSVVCAYGVVASKCVFHHGERSSNPGWGSELSYC